METAELIKKVRKIEIKTRGLSRHLFSGEYHSVFKGRGMAFSEVREYQPGDDIRSIDWNVTARFNNPFVKIFQEERELTVIILVDLSASKSFGSRKQFKEEIMTELAAVLAFSAIQNNDKIGVIFFTDIIEKFIPPKKGTSHILRIVSELINFQPTRRNTDIAGAVRYFSNAIKKRCTAFIISDFLDDKIISKSGEDALKIANKKHDIIALRIYDHREMELPHSGLLKVRDIETGKILWFDSSSNKVRDYYQELSGRHNNELADLLTRCGIDSANIRTDESYVKPLMMMFKKRERRG